MRSRLKRPSKNRKDCFCTAGICKWTVVLKMKTYNLQMFSRPSNIKWFLYLQILSYFKLLEQCRCIRSTVEHLKQARTVKQAKVIVTRTKKKETKKLSVDYKSIILLCAVAYLDNANSCFYNF